MIFNVVKPTDPIYADMREQIEVAAVTNKYFDYIALAHQFNDSPVGSIIQFPHDKDKGTGFIVQLGKRGLVRGKDYELAYADVSDEGVATPEWNAFLTKLTDTKASTENAARSRKPMTEEAKVASLAKRKATQEANRKAAAKKAKEERAAAEKAASDAAAAAEAAKAAKAAAKVPASGAKKK